MDLEFMFCHFIMTHIHTLPSFFLLPLLHGKETIVAFSSGITIHGGPSPERGAGEHVWELHHPKGPVISISRVTGWDPGSGCQPGVEERELWQRRERLAAAAGVCLQLRPVAQDGQISTEVRHFIPYTCAQKSHWWIYGSSHMFTYKCRSEKPF